MHYGPPLLRWLAGRRNIDLITKIITVIVFIQSSYPWQYSLDLFLFSSSPIPLPCFCELLSTSLVQCLFEPVYSFFYLSEQVIHPVSSLLSSLSLSRSHYKRWSPIELINAECTPFTHWLMSLRRGMSPSWQLLLSRNILMAPHPTKMLRVDQPVPPTLPIPWCSLLLFLKCQRQSWIGQDNKHLNKALSLINERWRGLGRPLTASRR